MEQTEKNDIGYETFRISTNPPRRSQRSNKKYSIGVSTLDSE